jgi:multidrug efflux pump
LPDEDQGEVITLFQLPSGSTFNQTDKVAKAIEHHFLVDEKADVLGQFVVQGFSFAGSGQNAGLAFTQLADWKDRKGAKNRAPAIAARAMGAFSQIRNAQVFSVIPPAVQELGNATGFDFELEDQGGLGHERLAAARNQLLGMAAQDHSLVAVRPNGLPDTPQLKVDVNSAHATALGLNLSDVYDTLSTAWGGSYVNNFIDRGRVKRVYVEGDAPFRSKPDDLNDWFVRGSSGTMAPFSAFADTRWLIGPAKLERYNGLPAFEIQGQAAPGVSSGTAMDHMEATVRKLPQGVGFEWTGLSYEERLSGSQAPMLYTLSILVVFLCLAALYESWSVPVAIVLVIPLGIVGAVLAATVRGFSNDVYFQVGLLTTMGLAAKNAILIVEFAEGAEREGKSPVDAAIEGARLRLRPILMTSLAFIAGVFPLAISSGAGSGGQNDIGTGVVGGMLTATVLAIFFVPLFFVLVRKFMGGRPPGAPSADQERLHNAGEPE